MRVFGSMIYLALALVAACGLAVWIEVITNTPNLFLAAALAVGIFVALVLAALLVVIVAIGAAQEDAQKTP
jgi:hypothetical protein